MVDVVNEGSLNKDIRDVISSRMFPVDEYERILSAVKDAPNSVFESDQEDLDAHIAKALPNYHFEQASERGRNPKCKLWEPEFDYSIDLYNSEKRIAIEIEKSQRKRISDDILKFIRKKQQGGRQKIEFGCLIVPVNWSSSNDNLYNEAMAKMRFIRTLLHVEDVVVIGYREQ